jgi:hypothetical protein
MRDIGIVDALSIGIGGIVGGGIFATIGLAGTATGTATGKKSRSSLTP